jgi:hypothetical protein
VFSGSMSRGGGERVNWLGGRTLDGRPWVWHPFTKGSRFSASTTVLTTKSAGPSLPTMSLESSSVYFWVRFHISSRIWSGKYGLVDGTL